MTRWRGARSASRKARGDDFYETPACVSHALLRAGEPLLSPGAVIWEPAAGCGAVSRVLAAAGFRVVSSDLIAYPDADSGIRAPVDFLLELATPADVTVIVTNPPYLLVDAFVRHGLAFGLPVIILQPVPKVEGSARSDIVDRHLRRMWVGIERPPMLHRGGWEGPRSRSTGGPYAWFAFTPDEQTGPIELRRISWRETPSTNCGPDRPSSGPSRIVRPDHGDEVAIGHLTSAKMRKVNK